MAAIRPSASSRNVSAPRSFELAARLLNASCCVGVDCINKAGATTLERCPDKPDHKGGDKSLARLWWDEIFTTCIGRMMIHSHRNMHPGEFRSFSAREYARAQGFPDWYVFSGSIYARYRQARPRCCHRPRAPDCLLGRPAT